MDNEENKSVAVVGLGKLGLPLALVLAERGFSVIGVEKDKEKVEKINKATPPFREPGLPSLLDEMVNSGKLRAVPTLKGIDPIPEVIIILVGTPTDSSGVIDCTPVIEAVRQTGVAISESDRFHTIAIASTVIPGICSRAIGQHFKKTSKKSDDDFGICYVPENVQLGNVINGFRHPDYVCIGSSCDRATEQVLPLYDTGEYPIFITSLVNAEVSKLALNCFLTLKITYANELANLCERLAGADVDVISNIIGHDNRVGRCFLTGGGPFGGFCFPRDVSTMIGISHRARTRFPLVETVSESNASTAGRIMGIITTELLTAKNRRVAVLGLSFKTGVPYREYALGSMVAQNLRALSVRLRTYDPMCADESSVKDAETAVHGAGVILVANDDPAFYNLEYKKDQLVIDVWRCLDGNAVRDMGARYIGLGLGE